MPFDDNIYHAAAQKGDVGSVALHTSIGMLAIRSALEKIAKATGVDLSEEIDSLIRSDRELDTTFDKLTGWVPESKK